MARRITHTPTILCAEAGSAIHVPWQLPQGRAYLDGAGALQLAQELLPLSLEPEAASKAAMPAWMLAAVLTPPVAFAACSDPAAMPVNAAVAKRAVAEDAFAVFFIKSLLKRRREL